MGCYPEWIGHININVGDLRETDRFYATVLGMRQLLRMAESPRQSGRPFAVAGEVGWNGMLLGYDRTLPTSGLDVLQWDPPMRDDDVGSHRRGLDEILFSSPDLHGVRDRARALDCNVTEVEHVHPDGSTEAVVHLQDPDGIHIEVDGNSETPRLRGVRINCTSLDESVDFYRRVCGLTALPRITCGVGEQSCDRQVLRYDGTFDTFRIELSQTALADRLAPTLSAGNAIGIYRIAFMVADLTRTVDWLTSSCGIDPVPAEIEIGNGMPTVHAAFFDDPDGVTVQFIDHGFLMR